MQIHRFLPGTSRGGFDPTIQGRPSHWFAFAAKECKPSARAWRACLVTAVLAWTLLAAASSPRLRAQDDEGGNPTGNTGDYNGEITTGCGYDPLTGNAKRAVTDLVVQGSNGAYPLAFTRVFNSRSVSVDTDFAYFGDGINWRHSYQWTIAAGTTVTTPGQPGIPNYTVAYPDGRVVTFRTGRDAVPQGETCWRGPSGVADRLEVVSATRRYLHLSDGGVVCFDDVAHPNRPSMIVDPNRAFTQLTYTSGQRLSVVTEPGGRTLTFLYGSVTFQGQSTTVLTSVGDASGRTVVFGYDQAGTYTDDNVAVYPYVGLKTVTYNYELLGGSTVNHVQSTYTFGYDGYNQNSPVLATCQDPHYGGAMVNLRYTYAAVNGVVGQVQEEQNYQPSQPAAAGERVSRRDRDETNN